MTLNEFKLDIGCNNITPYENYYDIYVEKYKEISIKRGSYITYKELHNNEWGLPQGKWFVKYCPSSSVMDYNSFVEWCDFRPKHGASKELVIKIIYNMQSKLNRPLMMVDFENPDPLTEVGRSYIDKYWGNLNNMKTELGLEIVQEDMSAKSFSFEDMKQYLEGVCRHILATENRTLISTTDINRHCRVKYATYYNIFKKNNTSVRDYLNEIGFELQKCGTGFNHTFEDGETTYSMYEYEFSKKLKESGFVFNKDYYRDVMYKDFARECDSLIDCDYVIYNGNKGTYIEIAGILRDHEYQFLNNIEIHSSSREHYRINLNKKESILRDNNLKYHILLPSKCNDEYFDKIIKRVRNNG